MGIQDDQRDQDEQRDQADPLRVGQRLGRFELCRKIGAGGMGVVFEAHDPQRDLRVALKTLDRLDTRALYFLKNEFRSLHALGHPNVVSLHEFVRVDHHWLLVMDLVDGEPFDLALSADVQAARVGPPAVVDESTAFGTQLIAQLPTETLDVSVPATEVELRPGMSGSPSTQPMAYSPTELPPQPRWDGNEPRLREMLAQLSAGILAIHQAGKVHGDLKPANVLVDGRAHLVILDFGLCVDLQQDPEREFRRPLVGTPAYLAPEMIVGDEATPACDWYAVGVMLHELLVGQLPFEGSSMDMMLARVRTAPRPVRDRCADLPEALATLCDALLDRDPVRRAGFEAIQRYAGTRASQVRPQRALFVGREQELGRLRRALTRARAGGHPGVMCVRGPSGIGKTELASALVREQRSDGVLVLRGRCFERESAPYKVFDAVVDELVGYLRELPVQERTALLPPGLQFVTRLFPMVEQLLPGERRVESVSRDPEDAGPMRTLAFEVLRDLLRAVARVRRVLVCIDDVHWGDRDSGDLLRVLLAGDDPPELFLLALCRREEAAQSSFVQTLMSLPTPSGGAGVETLELGHLSRRDGERLAALVLEGAGRPDPQLARRVAAESAGVPLFVRELGHHVATRSAPPAGSPRGAVSLPELLDVRVSEQSEDARALLRVLAVAGRPLPQGLVVEAAGCGPGGYARLHGLGVVQLVRSRGPAPEDLAETYHDRIRACVVEGMEEGELARLHGQLAGLLERREGVDPEWLLEHCLGAGLDDRAILHAERAASRARSALAFARAAELYKEALSAARRCACSDMDKARIQAALGAALADGGHCLEAADALLNAARVQRAPAAAELRRQATDQLLRGGDLDAARPMLRQLLEDVGVPYPESSAESLRELHQVRLQIEARGLDFDAQPEESMSDDARARLEALRITLGVFWMVEPVRGAFFAGRYLLEALEAGQTRHVLRGLQTESAYLALRGGPGSIDASLAIVKRSAGLVRRSGSATTLAGARFAEAGFHGITGRKEESTRCALEALSRPDLPRISWERAYARFLCFQNALYIGGGPGLTVEVETAVEEAQSRDDRFAMLTLLPMLCMAELMADRPDRALEAMARMRPMLSRELVGYLGVQELIWTSLAHLYRGESEEAWQHYVARHRQYLRSGMSDLQLWRQLHRWGSSLVRLALLGTERGGRPASLSGLKRDLRGIAEERDCLWPQGFAAGGLAALQAWSGDQEGAAQGFEHAIEICDRLGYRPFAACYRVRLAELQRDSAQRQGALEALSGWGIVRPERWLQVWSPGRC